MNKGDALLALTNLFRTIFNDDSLILLPETSAKDIEGWDSFMQVEILLATQERFGFKLGSKDIDAIQCVGDLVDVIDRRLAGAP